MAIGSRCTHVYYSPSLCFVPPFPTLIDSWALLDFSHIFPPAWHDKLSLLQVTFVFFPPLYRYFPPSLFLPSLTPVLLPTCPFPLFIGQNRLLFLVGGRESSFFFALNRVFSTHSINPAGSSIFALLSFQLVSLDMDPYASLRIFGLCPPNLSCCP